jgi:hypothetical protein
MAIQILPPALTLFALVTHLVSRYYSKKAASTMPSEKYQKKAKTASYITGMSLLATAYMVAIVPN